MLPGPCSAISIPRRFSSLAKPSVLCEHPLRYWMPLSAYANQMVEFGIRPAIAVWRGCLVYAELYPKDDTEGTHAFAPETGLETDTGCGAGRDGLCDPAATYALDRDLLGRARLQHLRNDHASST